MIAWWQSASWFVFGAIVARYWCYRARFVGRETISVSASERRPGLVHVAFREFGHKYDLPHEGAMQVAESIVRVVQLADAWRREKKP